MREVKFERSRALLGDDGIEKYDEGGMNSGFLHVGENMDPDEVKVPKPPNDCIDPDTNTAKGDPEFNKLYIPCGQSSCSYRNVFKSVSHVGQYKFHCIPARFQPVHPNEDDNTIRTHEGRKCFC